MVKLGFILYITLFFVFMQDCAIGHPMLLAGAFFINLSLFLLLLKNEKIFIDKVKEIYKKTPFKYLVWFVIWALISGMFVGGGLSVKLKIITQVFLIFGLSAISAVIFAVIVIPKYISFQKITNFFIGVYEFILVYGVLKFYIPMDFIHNILCNRMNGKTEENLANFNVTFFEPVHRATSIFFEPSFFATFLFLFMPFLYTVITSGIKLSKNKNIDFAIKGGLILLTWLNIVICRSPIYMVFCIIYTVIYFGQKKYLKQFRKYAFKLLIIIFISAIIIGAASMLSGSLSENDNKEKGIAKRIEKIVQSKSIEEMMCNDGSIVTRIDVTVNGVLASLHCPIFGTGYGNTNDVMTRQLLNTPIPLTDEVIVKSLVIGPAGAPPIIFISTMLQTGIPGVILMYMFFILSIVKCRQIEKYFIGKEKYLLSSVILIAINYMVISIYWSIVYYPFMWFIFGILISYICEYRNRKQMLYHIQEQNKVENNENNI